MYGNAWRSEEGITKEDILKGFSWTACNVVMRVLVVHHENTQGSELPDPYLRIEYIYIYIHRTCGIN